LRGGSRVVLGGGMGARRGHTSARVVARGVPDSGRVGWGAGRVTGWVFGGVHPWVLSVDGGGAMT
jgi:hypothetical protein